MRTSTSETTVEMGSTNPSDAFTWPRIFFWKTWQRNMFSPQALQHSCLYTSFRAKGPRELPGRGARGRAATGGSPWGPWGPWGPGRRGGRARGVAGEPTRGASFHTWMSPLRTPKSQCLLYTVLPMQSPPATSSSASSVGGGGGEGLRSMIWRLQVCRGRAGSRRRRRDAFWRQRARRCSRHSAPCCPEPCWAECPPNIPIKDRNPDDLISPTPTPSSTRHGHSHNCYWSPSLDHAFHLPRMLCWTVRDMFIFPYDLGPTVDSLEAIPTPGWLPTTQLY